MEPLDTSHLAEIMTSLMSEKRKPKKLLDTSRSCSILQNIGKLPTKNMQKMIQKNWSFMKETAELGIH